MQLIFNIGIIRPLNCFLAFISVLTQCPTRERDIQQVEARPGPPGQGQRGLTTQSPPVLAHGRTGAQEGSQPSRSSVDRRIL